MIKFPISITFNRVFRVLSPFQWFLALPLISIQWITMTKVHQQTNKESVIDNPSRKAILPRLERIVFPTFSSVPFYISTTVKLWRPFDWLINNNTKQMNFFRRASKPSPSRSPIRHHALNTKCNSQYRRKSAGYIMENRQSSPARNGHGSPRCVSPCAK